MTETELSEGQRELLSRFTEYGMTLDDLRNIRNGQSNAHYLAKRWGMKVDTVHAIRTSDRFAFLDDPAPQADQKEPATWIHEDGELVRVGPAGASINHQTYAE